MDDAYLSESRQPQLYAAYTVTYAFAIIAVCLRLAARKYFSKAGIWLDDYAIVLSLVIASGDYIDMIMWVYRGVGKHIESTGPEGIRHFFLSLFVCEIFYTLTLCFTKCSILLFYLRIFGRTNIRISLVILALIIAGWTIVVIAATIFQCNPVQGFWDKSINPTCSVNVYAFFIGNAVPNIVTDWALLLLPIPYIWRLHQSKAQKIALSGVFGLGGFICIISIVRLYIMVTQLFHTTSMDVTWIFIGSSTWTAVEVNIGIVSACLPSLRPILTAIFGKAPFASDQRRTGCSTARLRASDALKNVGAIWPNKSHETYICGGSGHGKDIEKSERPGMQTQTSEASNRVFVRSEISVVASQA
ncbi:hypothetical protein ACLMJK_002988 [Lecanora helva]